MQGKSGKARVHIFELPILSLSPLENQIKGRYVLRSQQRDLLVPERMWL